jgi:hypothetical protein
MKILTNERVFITGKTGSGKTFLSKYITRSVRRLVVCDSKGTLTDWGLDPWNRDTIRDLAKGKPVRIRALPPINIPLDEYWEDVFTNVYNAGEVTIYIDEMYAVVPPGKNPPDILTAIYTRGREAGIGAWAATQRPVWVPLMALSEAEHFFMFRLTLEEDRRRMAAFMTETVLIPIRDIHGFYYMAAAGEEPDYYKKLDIGSGAPNINKKEVD